MSDEIEEEVLGPTINLISGSDPCPLDCGESGPLDPRNRGAPRLETGDATTSVVAEPDEDRDGPGPGPSAVPMEAVCDQKGGGRSVAPPPSIARTSRTRR
jgi:hypothetical protein